KNENAHFRIGSIRFVYRSAFQNFMRNCFLSFDSFTKNVGVPTNYVSLAIDKPLGRFFCLRGFVRVPTVSNFGTRSLSRFIV
ncbi:hypothetical protein, partial [Leptospira santarosai]|uniref:hypothetical protein n=1 Tax=Leptospira santarosai TaxID=28183 RepID=UPI0040359449